MLRTSLKVVPVVVAGSAVATYVAVRKDEGLRRSLTFWKHIFPVYAHYRYVQLLNRDLRIMSDEDADVKYNELHELYSDKVKDIVYDMRGFYLKQAQLMSTQDDFVPPAYMRWVKDTQDKVPSEFKGQEAREYCAKMLKEEQGMSFDDVFSSWDDTPVGVASIGQVHKAVLKATGEPVAVKILVPGIEPKFRSDIRTTRSFCKLAMPQHVSAFDEIERQFCTEFDYKREAENLDEIYRTMIPKFAKAVQVPRPHLGLCSKHVLVMEYLDGVKLVDGIRSKFRKVAELSGKTVEEIEAERKALIAQGKFHFQSIDEAQQDRKRLESMLLINDLTKWSNISKFLYNNSPAGWLYGTVPYEWTEAPIDLSSVIQQLSLVHANQIFQHGVFNGDPHPGNVLYCADGRLGLIDYGQVKRMTLEERINYAKLILAHARGDKKEVVRLHFDVLGTKTKYRDEEVGYLMSCFYNDRDTADVTKGLNIAEFVDELQAKDPMVRLPEEYLFAARVNIMLRGIGKAFGLKLRMSQLWEAEAKAFLKSQGIEY